MDRLEQIQDEIAQSMGFKNMDSVDSYANFPELDRIYNLSAKQYARECVEASLEKAVKSLNSDDSFTDYKYNILHVSNIVLL